MREDGGLDEIERVGRKELLEHAARFAHERGAFFHLRQQCGNDQQRGKNISIPE